MWSSCLYSRQPTMSCPGTEIACGCAAEGVVEAVPHTIVDNFHEKGVRAERSGNEVTDVGMTVAASAASIGMSWSQ